MFSPVFTACSKQNKQTRTDRCLEGEKKQLASESCANTWMRVGGVATNLRDVQVACVTSQRADISMFQLEILSEKRSSQKEVKEGLLHLW